ncbi:MAG: AMP-binding protein [Alphaproteobacteria bacterium]|nr:AMP-binding protein [Alphaproteobacteria bacterium]
MAEPSTIPGYLLRNAADPNFSDQPAMREKSFGIWETYDWQSYVENVRSFSLGLADLGFAADDKLAVIGNNRPRLYWAQLSAMCLGGQSVPVYQDAIASELSYVLAHSEASVIVVEDQEQVDKVLSIRDELPNLKWLIYDYSRGLASYDVDILKSYEEVQTLGRAFAEGNPNYLENEIAKISADSFALIAYTSGTTGQPKGVILSHENLIETARIFIAAEDVRKTDDFLSYLPMAWVGDALYGLCVSIMVGASCNCPEEPETIQRDLRELGPTGIVAAPRVWEGILSSLQVRAEDSTPLKKLAFNYFRGVADAVEQTKLEGKPLPLFLKIKQQIGEFMVYGPVRDQLGLRRARWCYTGGAPLGPDTFRFFRGFGINLKQVYGMTESTGLVSLQTSETANPDTVGEPCQGIDVSIAKERSEVLIRSKGIFKGYYKQDDKTREAIDAEGWFHTGDAGMIDERGHLVIVDRAKDVGKLSDGTVFAPQFIELKLKYSPYINEAVAFGDGQAFVSTMIAIDLEAVGKWAEKGRLPYTNYMDLAQKSEVRALIAEEIRQINLGLPEVQRIKRFLLLTKDLDADDNEVTRTRKLRRAYIMEKYAPVLNAFYGGGTAVELKLDVTFEDGSRSQIDSHLVIEEAA